MRPYRLTILPCGGYMNSVAFLGEIRQWDGIEDHELAQLDPHADLGTHLWFYRRIAPYNFYMVRNDSGETLEGMRIVEHTQSHRTLGYLPLDLDTKINPRDIAVILPYTQPIPPGASFWVCRSGLLPVAIAPLRYASAVPADPIPPAVP